MRPGARNLITDVAGLTVGQAQDATLRSGVTVVTGPAPFVAAVHVMGGAPGTRETDLLSPDRMVQEVDALFLSGGSALGLAACDGVAAGLRDYRFLEANTKMNKRDYPVLLIYFDDREEIIESTPLPTDDGEIIGGVFYGSLLFCGIEG